MSVDNNFEMLDSLLSSLVENIKKYKKEPEKEMKKEIEETILEMRGISKILSGKILEEFFLLEENIEKFLLKRENFDVLLERCVHFKNELWKL